jgi:hypothetical protein
MSWLQLEFMPCVKNDNLNTVICRYIMFNRNKLLHLIFNFFTEHTNFFLAKNDWRCELENTGLWIRIHLNTDPGPAFLVNQDPDTNWIGIRIQSESESVFITGYKHVHTGIWLKRLDPDSNVSGSTTLEEYTTSQVLLVRASPMRIEECLFHVVTGNNGLSPT